MLDHKIWERQQFEKEGVVTYRRKPNGLSDVEVITIEIEVPTEIDEFKV
jgi:hypothetical protein